MPCHIRILTPSGLETVAYTAASLSDAQQYEPQDGVYTITNTYQRTRVLRLDAHLDRLEDSAAREHIPLALQRTALRQALRQMIEDSPFGDVRFRITVPRSTPDRIILSIEPFQPPAETTYTQGVRCVTLPHAARHNPAAKTTGWQIERDQIKLPPGIYTGLLLGSDSTILEGVSSNFYAITDGELRTAGGGVLPGIAQQIVFAVAPAILPLRREAIRTTDLPRTAECFITSSSRGIMPVVEIDGQPIGGGTPGALTQRLRAAYAAWVSDHLEEL
jgi:branched-chain amino acid aminotransferase